MLDQKILLWIWKWWFNKEVKLRLTGVLSKFVSTSDIRLLTQGENITVRNVGEKILNPSEDRTKNKFLQIHGFIIHHQDF